MISREAGRSLQDTPYTTILSITCIVAAFPCITTANSVRKENSEPAQILNICNSENGTDNLMKGNSWTSQQWSTKPFPKQGQLQRATAYSGVD